MKILITGANGHLGSRAVKQLRIGNEVHAIVRANPAVALPDVTYHKIDLSSDWSTKVLPDHIDVVIHLAQSRHFRQFPEQALEIFQVNVESTTKLLDYALRAYAKRFVLASTGGLHRPSESMIGEFSPVDPPVGPLAYYFQSKHAAELLANPYKELIDILVLRPFFIYGQGQSDDKLIARLFTSVRDGHVIKLVGRDGLVINPVFVDDVVELLLSILDTPGSRTMTVAGPDALSIREIADLIGKKFGRNPVYEQTEGVEGRLIADHRAFENMLDRPLTKFSDGISQLLL
jgi:UDP-glucose 4-epimerase